MNKELKLLNLNDSNLSKVYYYESEPLLINFHNLNSNGEVEIFKIRDYIKSNIEFKRTLKWNINYLSIAQTISNFSYCKRKKVGCVIVKDNQILSDGFNGTIKGFDNICEDVYNKTHDHVLHAELNAITKLAKTNNSSVDSDCYVTLQPCVHCSKLLIQSNIKNIYFLEFYRIKDSIHLLSKTNINLYYLNMNHSKIEEIKNLLK